MSNWTRLSTLSLALVVASALACSSSSPGSPTGAAGQSTGAAGTTGAAGNATGVGGAGTSGAAGNGTTTGAAGAGSAGAGGTTGAAGNGATAGVGGTTGAAGVGAAGSGGAAGSAGATGMAGTTGAAGAGVGFANPSTYTCNLVLGVSVTYDWFTSGFETYVPNAKWEAMAPTTPGMSFIETWADPNGATWNLPKTSACTQNAASPERILFTGVNWTYTTAAQWVTALEAFITTAQKKFPKVAEIDLVTMLRAPNNMMGGACSSVEDVVQPYIDDAIQTVVAAHPKLVRAAPKAFAPSCDVFTGGGPHLTTAGKPIIAKVYGDIYSKEP